MFEKNIGQHKNEAKFVMRNNKGTVFFLDSEIVVSLIQNKEEEKQKREESIEDKLISKKDIQPKEYEVSLLKMKLENASESSTITGIDEFECKINYFKGLDGSKWTTNIPIYEKIIYEEIYEGIDLIYYENQGVLEHDFIVKPSGDVNNIKITFEGADKIEQGQEGNILISVKDNTLQMLKPKVYQEIDNTKVEVESSFLFDNSSIKFNVPSYDKSKTLVIDPPLLYGTYLGGDINSSGRGVAVDEKENAYIVEGIASWTNLTDEFPLKNEYQGLKGNAYQKNLKGNADAFLIKIDTKLSGKASLKYGTYLGGNKSNYGIGVAVDKDENAYITGWTTSADEFPLKNAYQESLKGPTDAFLIKMNLISTSQCDLVLEKSTCSCITYIGEKIPYTIKVANKGPDRAINIVVTDELQQGLKIDSYNASIGNIDNLDSVVTWTIAKLEVGESAIAMIVVKTDRKVLCLCRESGVYILNTASLICDNNIINPSSTTDTVMTYVHCPSRSNHCLK